MRTAGGTPNAIMTLAGLSLIWCRHFERQDGVADGKRKLIVADLNLNEIDQEFMTFDASGHYSRPDVFTFEIKSEQAVRT